MNAPSTSNKAPRWVETSYWICIVAVFVTWITALGTTFYREWEPQSSLVNILRFFGAGMTIVCGVLWIGHVTNIRSIPRKVAAALWVTLIVGVLGASVDIIRNTQGPVASAVVAERLTLVDVEPILKVLNNQQLNGGESVFSKRETNVVNRRSDIAFVFEVSGLALNSSGEYDAEVTYTLKRPVGFAAHIERYPITERPDEMETRSRAIPSFYWSDLHELVGRAEGKVPLAVIFTDRVDIGVGFALLRASIRDNVTGFSDSVEIPLLIREPN